MPRTVYLPIKKGLLNNETTDVESTRNSGGCLMAISENIGLYQVCEQNFGAFVPLELRAFTLHLHNKGLVLSFRICQLFWEVFK
jgi:hypothetical protein